MLLIYLTTKDRFVFKCSEQIEYPAGTHEFFTHVNPLTLTQSTGESLDAKEKDSQVLEWEALANILVDHEKKLLFTGSWYLSKYLKTSIGALTGFQTEWHFLNVELFAHHETCYTMWYRVYSTKSLAYFFTKRVDFVVLYTRLTYFRDPTALVPFIKKNLLQTHLKQHNRVFYTVCTFMARWYFFASTAQRIRGYSVFFKGKLAKKGSVRKSVFFKKKGEVSFTNKSLRVNYRNYYVWTYTGVIGAGLSIFYNWYVYICGNIHLSVFLNFRYVSLLPFCSPCKH